MTDEIGTAAIRAWVQRHPSCTTREMLEDLCDALDAARANARKWEERAREWGDGLHNFRAAFLENEAAIARVRALCDEVDAVILDATLPGYEERAKVIVFENSLVRTAAVHAALADAGPRCDVI